MAMVLIGCFVCQMGLGVGYVFSATLKHIVTEFEWSRAAFAAAGAPLLLTMALASPGIGSLSERLGVRPVLSISTLLLGLSLWLFSRMETLWQFYLTNVLFGIALTGLGDIVVGAVAARWVASRRGLALAFVYIGSNVGGAAVPLLAESVAARESWRVALVVIGVGAVALILPFALWVVRHPPVGYRPAGSETQPEEPRKAAVTGAHVELGLREAMRTRSFWLLGFVLFSFYFYYLGVTQHLVVFLSDIGYTDAEAAASLSFAVGLGIFGKLGIGWLSDRIERKTALIVNFSILTGGSFLLLGSGLPGCLPAFLVAHGFATAAENVLLPLVVSRCFGVRHMAAIYGALMVMLFPGGVLGPIFAGAVFDRLGSYHLAFGTFAVLNLVGLFALAWVRPEGAARSA